MKIYLDSKRKCPEGYTLYKEVKEVIYYLIINPNTVKELSISNDQNTDQTGIDLVKWIKEKVEMNKAPFKESVPNIIVHSNSSKNILSLISEINVLVNIRC